MRVTAKKLVDAGACIGCCALRRFKRRWPSGCEATLKNLEKVAEEDVTLMAWFAFHYLSDGKFSAELDFKEAELVDAFDSTVGKRYIDNAEACGRRFILNQQPQKQVINYLRVHKRSYNSARAYALINIAHKLARMVYDKIKSGAAKKRRAR